MEAKDTVMKITAENIKEYRSFDSYEVGDYDAPIKVKEEVWDIPKLLQDQAIISSSVSNLSGCGLSILSWLIPFLLLQ